MKKYISILAGILIIAGTLYINKKWSARNRKPTGIQPGIPEVPVRVANPGTYPVSIEVQGVLNAKESMDVVPEVQGIMRRGKRDFKPGSYFAKGETILRIDAQEFAANLRSLKSNFISSLTAVMPDIKMDFPAAYDKWYSYLSAIDMNTTLPPLPAFDSDKERYFITGRKITSLYYQVKNAEIRMSKYRITAPFSGYLTLTTTSPGSMVRPGQKLGVFKDLSSYEMQADIPSQYLSYIHTGKQVKLHTLDGKLSLTGTIIRINPVIDIQTHTLAAYISVKGKNLKEGMYLEAEIPAGKVTDAVRIPRDILHEDGKIPVIRDSILQWQSITPVFYQGESVWVTGLPEGTLWVTENLPPEKTGKKAIPVVQTKS